MAFPHLWVAGHCMCLAGDNYILQIVYTEAGNSDGKDKEKEDGITDKETEQQQVPDDHDMLQDTLAQHESISNSEQELCTADVEEKTNEHEVIKAAYNDDGIYQHRKQEERMVLEAGSKAAEIAKTVFGKPVSIQCPK